MGALASCACSSSANMSSTVSNATSNHFRQNVCCRCHHDTVSNSCDVIIRAGDLDMDFRELGLGFVVSSILEGDKHDLEKEKQIKSDPRSPRSLKHFVYLFVCLYNARPYIFFFT